MSQHTPFDDLDTYLDLRRVMGLAVSPDGRRVVVGVQVLDEKRTAFVSSLWEIDPTGAVPARRITWGATSESVPTFLPDGSLAFVATRADPDTHRDTDDDEPPSALWILPAAAGEARPLVIRPGGISGVVVVARVSGAIVVGSPTLPSATTAAEDAARRKARKDNKVVAMLHDSYPVRFWDANLGPERDRLFAGEPSTAAGSEVEVSDITGHMPAVASIETSWDVSADGSMVVTTWPVAEIGGGSRTTLVAIGVTTATRTTVLDDDAFEYHHPAISPGGTRVAVVAVRRPVAGHPPDERLIVVDLVTGETQDAAPAWDRWPAGRPVWAHDGTALFVVADELGRAPVFRIDLHARTALRLTGDDAAYTELCLPACLPTARRCTRCAPLSTRRRRRCESTSGTRTSGHSCSVGRSTHHRCPAPSSRWRRAPRTG